jgi:hypothetical protein
VTVPETPAADDLDACGFATVATVRTTRRHGVGALGASVLLMAVAACSSASDDTTAESAPDSATETSVETSESTDGETATTAAPSETTAAPVPDDSDDTGTDTGDENPPTTEAAVVVPEALRFTAPLVGGGTFDGAAVAGKPTVFWFWAPT